MSCFRLSVLCAFCCAVAACDSSGEPPDDGSGTGARPETLDGTLQTLGIDTTEMPRLDNAGDPYPDSFAPMGTIVSMRQIPDADEADGDRLIFGRSQELFLAGVRFDGTGGVLTIVDDLPGSDAQGGFTEPEILNEKSGKVGNCIHLKYIFGLVLLQN